MQKKVKCPTCGEIAEWDGNPNRPFCSQRCKLLDLGKWAEEEFRIAGESVTVPEHPNEYEN